MHLKSIALKGFKSFPDRTKLEFAPGVSVIVGPNGSGKSNVTDAVLWAMGEQSPLAVRGQSMQDVIFGGGRGVQARSSAEVEIVLDNADASVDLPMGEISIVRRLDRNGDGEYRLNGARCRLADVLEVLSDTGLGKEMHSVVSQGRVEAIVTSKPKDRRLLIEEAAGLGKHRKRRRRAQLKLERTQDNLDRALDVEREARSRLRPLKRQAEAAELHARLERQTLEARWELARDAVRARREELGTAETAATAARAARDEAEVALREVAVRREAAEQAMAKRTEQREGLARRVERARGSADRIELRLERTQETAQTVRERVVRRGEQLRALQAAEAEDQPDEQGRERIEALEAALVQLDEDRAATLERELAALEEQRVAAAARAQEAQAAVEERRSKLAEAEAACEVARQARRASESSAEGARREAARVGAELARANQFLRSHARSATGGAASLSDELEVEPGFELALSAALDGRLAAAIVEDRTAGGALLDGAGADGGRALVSSSIEAVAGGGAPVDGARCLAELVRGPDPAASLARRLLADTWVVEDLGVVPASFRGTAVTTAGRAWVGATGELRQAAEGGVERVLAERNRRDALIADSETAVRAEQEALGAVDAARQAVAAADASREEAERERREAERAHAEARESERQASWLIEQRRKAPEQGEAAVRRAQLQGELAAEKRVAERAAKEREERRRRIAGLQAALARDEALVPQAEKLAVVLELALDAVRNRVEAVEAELAADRAEGEGVAQELRSCAAEEARIQAMLRERGEAVTRAEVRAQQVRDQAAEATHELEGLGEKLGLAPEPATEPLDEEQRQALRVRVERLVKRREQLGPVNPLAKQEYDEAMAHVEELERQRTDLETALRELRTFIKDTDRQIRETFEETFAAAAKNFEELAAHCFPGGRGRLRLVREESGPKPVLGGQEADSGDGTAEVAAEAAAEAAADAEAAEGASGFDPDDDVGVEIEITPAGKAMKRLTLLSGGEKSMTAIAFLFSVFLAKPCPFYILDEVEAALDDLNISRFLDLLREYRDHAQFIVVTHQKRTMEAADTLYGVSMGGDGVSKVVSRKLPRDYLAAQEGAAA
ncbi:chromosome segregation SMC family protein [Conexibacter sp. SYSU D00693]|uniref:chromosome segregation SMC family protein n=1 Tax=Conexibacter sp. SYSU D00693 TaxID=2812560 RepID=UPI00196A6F3B|nr:AAA family ATPase [Conexibacter sp. SYSU D00693]